MIESQLLFRFLRPMAILEVNTFIAPLTPIASPGPARALRKIEAIQNSLAPGGGPRSRTEKAPAMIQRGLREQFNLEGKMMKAYSISPAAFATLALTICAVLATSGLACAQEVGGDLGGGAGIFRPKNPETTSKRRANPNRGKTGGGGGNTNRNSSRGNSAAAAARAAEIEEKVEDLLDEGNEARDARKYAEAEQLYRQAQQLKARDWRAPYGLGNVYVDQQRWAEAEVAYRQAVEFSPASVDAHIALSFVLVQPRTDGNNAKRFSDAEAAARRAIQLQSNNAIAYDRLGAALDVRGVANAETEAAYRRAVELDPQFAVAYVHLARLLRKMNRASEADPFYQRAAELARDAPTLVLIADSMQSEQRWLESRPVLQRALELDAKNPGALFLMGKMYVVNREYAQAEPYLKSTIEVSPRSFAPYYLLASTYLRLDRVEDAEKACTGGAAVASATDRKLLAGAYGFTGVGDAYMKVGRTGDAVRVYQRALELDPGNAEIQAKIADARSKSGR